MPDFLYIIFLIIAVFIRNNYHSINKVQEKLSNSLIKQEQQGKTIEHLVERCNFLEKEIELHVSRINSLNSLLKKQKEYIANILKENEDLKEKLEFYTEIEADSKKLNGEDTSNFKNLIKNSDDINLNDEELKLDEEQQRAFDLLNQTDKNLFITGKAGTGKSYLLREFARRTSKKILLLAPTGIAAINVQGATLHSTFGYDNLSTLALEQISRATIKLKKDKISLLEAVDIFIIDEISMVRSDVLEKINRILQIIMCNDLPFGGKRFVLFGDLYQLPPIARKEEVNYLKDNFGGIFFFLSNAYKKGKFEFIELTINHRQEQDKTFFNILNNIREDCVTNEDLEELNKRVSSDVGKLRRVIKLFPKKDIVEKTNRDELNKIPGKEYVYNSVITFSNGTTQFVVDKNFPITDELKLKNGALVMMVTNDPNKQWVNGTLGVIKKINNRFYYCYDRW